MIQKLLGSLNQRKVKVFLLFLLCSFFAWTISQLSESYESRATFDVAFNNIPDSLLLNVNSNKQLTLKLRASGFQFLNYGLNSKKLWVDLSKVAHGENGYYLDEVSLKPQLEKQFSNNISLLELEQRRLRVDLYRVISKKIPIKHNIDLTLAANHILKGKLVLNPEYATIKGPSDEVMAVERIETEPLTLDLMERSFSKTLTLIKPGTLENSKMLTKTVVLTGDIERFSEKELSVPIKAINIPEGYRMKLFSEEVTLVCKAGVDQLKTLRPTDFNIVVDGSKMKPSTTSLPLELRERPQGLYALRLLEDNVEFVLEKL